MKRALKLSVAFLIALGLLSAASAQSTSDNTDINVTVAQEVAVDLTPSLLEYLSVSPGNTYTTTDNSHGFTGVEINNIGSVNLSQVWLETSTPSSDPFGTGVASNYDPGNFLIVNKSGDAYRSFVNRKEYSENDPLNFINKPSDSWSEGRFRKGANEYFYVLNATGGSCNGSASHELRVGTERHNDTNTGTVDFVNGNYDSYTITGPDNGYGVVDNVQVGSRNYTVLTQCSGSAPNPASTTWRTRYNPELNGASGLTTGVAEYLNSNKLLPGETLGFGVALQIPNGVAEGDLSNGLLTVNARS